MLCIYHIADNDGKGSAAIVKSIYKSVEFCGFNHDMEVPYDLIAKHDTIVVCDIALPLDYMFELSKTKDFIWIDHHISAIEPYEVAVEAGEKPIKGLRRNGTAAIVLTWEYFYPQKPVPEGIKLLGLNDIFDLSDKKVRPFEYGFQARGINRPYEDIWQKMIHNELDVEQIIQDGERILDWIKIRNYRLARTLAFESSYMGYRCICANMPQGYSEFFDSVENLQDYDVMVNFYMDKKNMWKLTFYSDSNKDVDASKLAQSLGGGGHFHAAGASNLRELPEFLKKGLKAKE